MFNLILIFILGVSIPSNIEANFTITVNLESDCPRSTLDIFQQNNYSRDNLTGHSNLDTRYQIINNILRKYTRPFTMLDMLGESQWHSSFKAAYTYPESVFVIIDSLNSSRLLHQCVTKNSLNNIILLNKPITPQTIQRLSECEHFDVIVALNIFHDFSQSWQEIMDILLNMGSNVIVEISSQKITKEIEQHLLSSKAQIIGKIPDSTFDEITALYLIPGRKAFLDRKTWLLPLLQEKNYQIVADFSQKQMYKKVDYPPNTYQTVNWIPGINLITFKMCEGIFPTPHMLKQLFQDIRDESHNDWMINNMVIQGNKLQLIDIDDPTHNPGGPGGGNNASSSELYDNHCTMMDIFEPLKIEHFFWNYLIQFPIRNCSRNRFVKSLIKKDDVVFDIGSREGINTQLYVSHHAKVISIESNIKKIDNLYRSLGNNDQIIIVEKQLTNNIQHADKEITLEELINIYGFPQYCAFNIKNSEALILQLRRPFNSISFPFSMMNIESMVKCTKHLSTLGYQYFNFSSRHIPQFMISEWKHSEILLEKIKEFAQKDHEGDIFQGFVFARMENVEI